MDDKRRDKEDGKPVWQASDHERQVDADAYHIWTPRPLIRSVYWRPDPEPPREAVAGSYEVFLDQRVFAAMHEHVWNAAVGRSQFGYLIGDLCEDPSANRRFVIVTAVAPSRFPFLEAGPEQIPAEASVALQLEVERRRGVLVGWYHSHPAGEARLSPEDVATHERLFPESWQVAFLFVTDPRAPAGACFRRTPGGFEGDLRLPFYEMVTNESLLAKGVRRSRVDWENVSTLDTIRLEPPPRPEPPAGLAPLVTEPAPDLPTDGPPADAPSDTEGSPAETPSDTEGPPADTPSDSGETEQPKPTKPVGPPEIVPVDESRPVADEVTQEIPAQELPEPEAAPVDVGGLDLEDNALDSFQFEAVEEVDARAVTPGAGGDVVDEDLDDLDLDALIAEVEGAGLSEDDRAGADRRTGSDVGPGEAPELVAEEPSDSEPPSSGVSTGEPETDVEIDPLEEIESELTSGARVEAAVRPDPGVERTDSVATTYSPPDVPRSTSVREPGRTLRNRILVAAGIVICIGVVGVLALLLLSGPDEDPDGITQEAPAVVERPAVDPVATNPDDPVGAVEPPPAATPSVSAEELEQLSDQVLASISSYYGSDGAFESGEIGCAELQSSFVEVMDAWIDYSMRGKAGWQGRLPPEIEARDERLYLGVQDVERLFEASSCPRP